MKFKYQYGYSIFGAFILWRMVDKYKFAKKIAPLLLQPGQEETITPNELLPMFTSNFILRDGFRLYRAVTMEGSENGNS